MLTAFGITSAATMVLSYAFEARSVRWVAVFAIACAATAFYGILIEAWIFAVLESMWAVIAAKRFMDRRPEG